MWDIVMLGVGVGAFLACIGYIRVCESLRDTAAEPHHGAGPGEGSR